MKRFLVLVFAVTCCSIGCSESAPTVAESSPKDSPRPTMPPKGGEPEDTPPSNPENNGEKSTELSSQPAPNETTDRSAELDNVFESLFRHQFNNNASGAQQKANAYFLTIKMKNPPPEFLKRFAGHMPPVKNGTEFAIGKGLKFRIDNWKWVSDNKIELTGGYYESGVSSSGNRYILVRKKDGKWVVEKDEMQWIS